MARSGAVRDVVRDMDVVTAYVSVSVVGAVVGITSLLLTWSSVSTLLEPGGPLLVLTGLGLFLTGSVFVLGAHVRRRPPPVHWPYFVIPTVLCIGLGVADGATRTLFSMAMLTAPAYALLRTPSAQVLPVCLSACAAAAGLSASVPGSPALRGLRALLIVLIMVTVVVALLVLQRRLQAERLALHRLSREDPLTGVLNRRGLAVALERFDDHEGPLAVLVVDVDHFKAVNDRHGHDVGDRVLVEVAAHLQAHAGPTALLARWGGEEFGVVVPADPARARLLADRLRRAVEAGTTGTGAGPAVTVSVGVAVADPARHREATGPDRDGQWYERTFRRADEALLAAKAQGRNRVVLAPAGPGAPQPSPCQLRHSPA